MNSNPRCPSCSNEVGIVVDLPSGNAECMKNKDNPLGCGFKGMAVTFSAEFQQPVGKFADPVDWVYGACPECGGRGLQRERRFNGFDKCVNGHRYPSIQALAVDSLDGPYPTVELQYLSEMMEKAGHPLDESQQLLMVGWFMAKANP